MEGEMGEGVGLAGTHSFKRFYTLKRHIKNASN